MAIKEIKREWSPSQLAYVKEFLLHWESDVKELPKCCVGSRATVSETDNEYVLTDEGWKLHEEAVTEEGTGSAGGGGVQTVNGVAPDENGNVDVAAGGVGKSMEGMSVQPTNGKYVTAQTGAEIFNDTRERTFYVSGLPSAGNVASGKYAHAEGSNTTASGEASHAEGKGCTASNSYAHAEGNGCIASNSYAHAEGNSTEASGLGAHAEGQGTIAASTYQHVQGRWNVKDAANVYAHIVGNGTGNTARANIHTIDWNGNAWFAGTTEGTGLILQSSTAGSTKRFLITVDDSGTLTTTEVA